MKITVHDPEFRFTDVDINTHLTIGLRTTLERHLDSWIMDHKIKHLQVVHDGYINPIFIRLHYQHPITPNSKYVIEKRLEHIFKDKHDIKFKCNIIHIKGIPSDPHYIYANKDYFDIMLILTPKNKEPDTN